MPKSRRPHAGRKTDPTGPLDGLGAEVPRRLRPTFAQVPALRGLMGRLAEVRRSAADLSAGPAGAGLGDDFAAACRRLHRRLFGALPWAVCPACQGSGKKCDRCGRKGYLTLAEHQLAQTGNGRQPAGKGRKR